MFGLENIFGGGSKENNLGKEPEKTPEETAEEIAESQETAEMESTDDQGDIEKTA